MKAKRIFDRPGAAPFLAAGVLLLSIGLAGRAARAEGPERVGSETCLGCHSDHLATLDGTKHAVLFKGGEGDEAKWGCESCHGPGGAHVEGPPEGIINFKGDAAAGTEQCLKCHSFGERKTWKAGAHAENDVECSSCHQVHRTAGKKDKEPEKQFRNLKAPQLDLCLSCHEEKRADINMPSHHPVKQGKVNCADCHNPHGAAKTEMEGEAGLCIECHQEKAGPFVYEHEPATESCVACHQPHGSINQNLLKQREPTLCLQCHVTTDAPVHQGANCSSSKCHTKHEAIHGSNGSPQYFSF